MPLTNFPSLELKLLTQSGKSNALLPPVLRSVNEKPEKLLCLRSVPNYSMFSNQPPGITSDQI